MFMKEMLDRSIESHIIKLLQISPLVTIDIINKIKKIRPNTPKQSIYLALRKLTHKEIVVTHKKIVSLHKIWIARMKDFFIQADAQSAGHDKTGLLQIQEKESITYRFNSLLALDMYWAHAFTVYLNSLLKNQAVLVYNPHEWFLIARKKSELSVMQEAKRRDIFWLCLIGGRGSLDREVKKYFNDEKTRCYLLEKPLLPDYYYMNCFGDFIIEVWIDEFAAKEIDRIYKTYTSIEGAAGELQKIIESKEYSHKMKISKNSSKAKKFDTMFKKYFMY